MVSLQAGTVAVEFELAVGYAVDITALSPTVPFVALVVLTETAKREGVVGVPMIEPTPDTSHTPEVKLIEVMFVAVLKGTETAEP